MPPVAWRLLWLNCVGQPAPDLAATAALLDVEIRILAPATGRRVRTGGEAVLALGNPGGYTPYRSALPRNPLLEA